MSQWTHVNASFRLNSIGEITDERIEEIFGKEVCYDDLEYATDYETMNTLPMGSEGTLHINIWHNPHKSCLASTTVHIFGDLRDFGGTEDIEKLKSWFEKCCSAFMIRQAIIQISDEWQDEPIVLIRG